MALASVLEKATPTLPVHREIFRESEEKVASGFPMPATLTQASQAFVLHCAGDCMAPLIRPGDALIVDPSIQPRHAQPVAVSLDGTVLVRRLFMRGPMTSLLPDNPDYDAIPVEPGFAFRVLGVVTHVIRPVA